MSDKHIPGVLTRRAAIGGSSLVFDSPHSGADYPDSFDHAAPRSALRKSEDAFIDALYDDAPSLGVPLLAAHFPRCFIDANRSVADMDPAMVAGDWPHPVSGDSGKAALGVGLIWAKARPDYQMYDRLLTIAETEKRIETYWRPYHQELLALLNETHAAYGEVWHVNCHSMPSWSDDMSPEGPGHHRPEFCLGDRKGKSCDPAFTEFVRQTLIDLGYQVTVNDPYSGAELVKAYANPDDGRHSLQIEIRRDLYMDETAITKSPSFDKLRADLAKLTAALVDWTKARRA